MAESGSLARRSWLSASVALGVCAISSLLLTPAVSAPGSASDPAGDHGDPPYKVDLRTIRHDDSATQLTYWVESYTDFFMAPSGSAHDAWFTWLLDVDGDAEPDCAVNVSTSDNRTVRCPFGQETGPATMTRETVPGSSTSTTANSMKVVIDRSSVSGLGSSSYRYFVETGHPETGNAGDRTPDSGFLTHTLGGSSGGPPAPTSTPASTPASSPTTQPLPRTGNGNGNPTSTSTAAVSSASVEPGGALTISGGGFAPGRDLDITLFSNPVSLGTTRSDGTGRYSASVTIPTSTSPGPHRIVVSGPGREGGLHESVASITVASRSRLPDTGAAGGDPRLLALIGGTFLLGGAGVLSARRALRTRLSSDS